MITYWLIALLIGLLSIDFVSYLRVISPTSRAPWTIPTTLLIVCTSTAIFCIGLAWRYSIHVGNINVVDASLLDATSYDAKIDILGSWFPYVLLLLALCIVAGLVESWRSSDTPEQPARDPYLLLETSLPAAIPLSEQPLREKWHVTRGLILTFSILIGFAGAAYLWQLPVQNAETTFFALDRIRPTPQPLASSAFEPVSSSSGISKNSAPNLATDDVMMPKGPIEHQIFIESEYVGGQIDNRATGESGLAIGGPIRETPIEVISSDMSYSNTNAVEAAPIRTDFVNAQPDSASIDHSEATVTAPSTYTVVVQAALGVKARTEPNANGEVIDALSYGKSYRALGRTTNGSWIQVQLNEVTTAWIITEAVDGILFDISGKIVALDELPSVTH